MSWSKKAGRRRSVARAWRVRVVALEMCTVCGRVTGVACADRKGRTCEPHMLRDTARPPAERPLTQRDISDYLP